jgi:hypothetical protein
MAWRSGSSSEGPSLQVQSLELKSQSYPKIVGIYLYIIYHLAITSLLILVIVNLIVGKQEAH